MQRAAVYHFTDKSEKRPGIYINQLDELKRLAASLCPDTEPDVYCDMSLKTSEHVEFERLLNNIEDYDFLITKDFYHISRKTTAFLSIAKDILLKGTRIVTLENGELCISKYCPEEKHRVAVYASQFNPSMKDSSVLKVRIASLYIETKTNWDVVGSYSDKSNYQREDDQIELNQMIKDEGNFDMVVVNSLADLHWNIAGVVKVAEMISKPVFSLQDGLFEIKESRE